MKITIDNEVNLLLYRCKAESGVSAVPVIRRLITEVERPLLDLLPPIPPRRDFRWPSWGATPTFRENPPLWP
jgi:hypothetical protein